MKYTYKILLLILASMSWTVNAKGMLMHNEVSHHSFLMDDDEDEDEDDDEEGDEDEDDDIQPSQNTTADDDLPEGLTDREVDQLLNDWAVKSFLSDSEACDPSATNPEFDKETYVDRLSRLPFVVETPYNDIVRSFIDRYAGRMRHSVSIMLGASNFYNPIFEEALESYQVPLEMKYLPIIESALNPAATSRVGAAGLWQFMPATGKKYGLEVTSLIDDRRDPIKASYAAAHFLKDLYGIFGDWTLCIAAYNCGPGNVSKAITRAGGQRDFWAIYPYLPRETRGYVPAYIAAAYIMNYYCDHNICPAKTRLPLATDTIMITRNLHLDQVAHFTNVDIDELKALNPQYRTQLIPGHNRPCTLKLPTTVINTFLAAGDSVYNYRASELFTRRAEVEVSEGQNYERPTYTRKVSKQNVGRGGRKSKKENVGRGGKNSRTKATKTGRNRGKSATARSGRSRSGKSSTTKGGSKAKRRRR